MRRRQRVDRQDMEDVRNDSIIAMMLVFAVWSLYRKLPLALLGGATWFWLVRHAGRQQRRGRT
jgi:hypothetical protein